MIVVKYGEIEVDGILMKIKILKSRGDFFLRTRSAIGSGLKVNFGMKTWCGGGPLKNQFAGFFNLASHKNI